MEIAGRDATQVKHRQQRIQTSGPPAQRQDRRAEPDPLAISGRPAVANLRPRNLDRATHLDKDELQWFGSIVGEDLATPSVFR